MQLTRRGWAVVGIVVLAELLALGFGARALNAVAAPGVALLGAGVVHVYLKDAPSAERTPPAPGFAGDSRTVTLDVSGSGIARLDERVPESLAVDHGGWEVTLPATQSYDVTYRHRGVYDLGPLEVRTRDALGIWERVDRAAGSTEVLVYPTVYQLEGARDLVEETLGLVDIERQEFDNLREYVPGDPLRDVHWKTTAKQSENIYVTEFADRQFDDEITIAASGDEEHVDAMATAAASLAVMALDEGLSVGLHAPYAQVPPDRGHEHREELFEILARTNAGGVPPAAHENADISIKATGDGVEVRFGEIHRTLDEMTVSRKNPYAAGEVAT